MVGVHPTIPWLCCHRSSHTSSIKHHPWMEGRHFVCGSRGWSSSHGKKHLKENSSGKKSNLQAKLRLFRTKNRHQRWVACFQPYNLAHSVWGELRVLIRTIFQKMCAKWCLTYQSYPFQNMPEISHIIHGTIVYLPACTIKKQLNVGTYTIHGSYG